MNKNIPKEIESLEDLPEESDFYKTIKEDSFLIYKTISILIFMNIIQSRFPYKYNEHFLIDGTFFVVPKAAYQVIVIIVHNVVENRFHAECYGILTNIEIPKYIIYIYYFFLKNKRILD